VSTSTTLYVGAQVLLFLLTLFWLTRGAGHLLYVVAAEDDGHLRDVTPHYAKDWMCGGDRKRGAVRFQNVGTRVPNGGSSRPLC
jgi:hypothetical protein